MLEGHNFQVVGVLDDWAPLPKFYDLNNNGFGGSEDLYMPWNLIVGLEFSRSGNTNCWKAVDGNGLQAFLNSECVWIQYWVELRNNGEESAYLDYLNSYVSEQQLLGRLERPLSRVDPRNHPLSLTQNRT